MENVAKAANVGASPPMVMRTFPYVVAAVVVCLGAATAFSEDSASPTALGALKYLPRGEAKNVARIEARDGKPVPELWHILVHDAKAETGLHEYVIAGDELVASRGVSQFAERLQASDVIGLDAVRIDSDRAAKLAQQYALANNAAVATMDYRLFREGDGAAPIWKVMCLDDAGQLVGSVVLTASKGTIVSHEGFPIEPAASRDKLTVSPSEVDVPAVTDAAAQGDGPLTENADPTATKKATASRSRSRDGDGQSDPPRRSEKGIFHRAGGKLQKFFTGRDTLSR
jgi:hypothetical protein